MDTPRILVVDDDQSIADALCDYLSRHGFEVRAASGGVAMDAALAEAPADLIVLDLMMPGEDGLSICRRLRPGGPPVLMLSAMGEITDRVVGLELGADDYLAKPFDPRELLARIRAVQRRREMSLLRAFAEHPRRILSRNQLLDLARGPTAESFDRAVDLQVSRLRRRLDDRGGGELIETVRGEGYRFTAQVRRN
jgi:two-component system OmpR family response regulator